MNPRQQKASARQAAAQKTLRYGHQTVRRPLDLSAIPPSQRYPKYGRVGSWLIVLMRNILVLD